MKKKIQNVCAVIGGTTLIMGAGLETESPIVVLVWLTISISLLYVGKAFIFQQNR